MTEDIDVTGIPWTPIVTEENPFIGTYNDGRFKIIDLIRPELISITN